MKINGRVGQPQQGLLSSVFPPSLSGAAATLVTWIQACQLEKGMSAQLPRGTRSWA